MTCTGESGDGTITCAKTVGEVVMTFTGCESAGAKCTSGGQGEGVVQTHMLESVIGLELVTFKEGREVRHIALDLYAAGGAGALTEYTCGGKHALGLLLEIRIGTPLPRACALVG